MEHEVLDFGAGGRGWRHRSDVWNERRGFEDRRPLVYIFASTLPLFTETGPQSGFEPPFGFLNYHRGQPQRLELVGP